MSDEIMRVSNLNLDFLLEVRSHEYAHHIQDCLACGTCTGGCPIQLVYPEYNPRKIIEMVRLGMRSQVLQSPYIWYCATCQTCAERCPREVGFFHILNVLKNMASQEGYAASPWIEQTKQIITSGISVPTQEAWIKKREELGLRPLKGAVSKVAKLLETLDLSNMQRGRP